jgi:hypothetical protein
MKKNVKILAIMNLLCYFSYLIFSYVHAKIEIKNWWVIVGFAPYFLVILSGFIVFHNEKDKYKILRVEAIADLLIRIFALCINFNRSIHVKFSLWFNLIIIALILSFILNIFLESLMYKKASLYKEIEEDIKYYEIPFEDRKNFNNMSRSVISQLIEPPVLFIVLLTIIGYKKSNSPGYVGFYTKIDACLLVFYFIHNYKALLLFYKDKIIARQAFIKENLYVVITIKLGIIFAVIRGLGYNFGAGVDFLLLCLQMVALYPNFVFRNKRALKVQRIRKAKEAAGDKRRNSKRP